MSCRYIFQDEQRSTLSRTYLCGYSFGVVRCMFKQCNRVGEEKQGE